MVFESQNDLVCMKEEKEEKEKEGAVFRKFTYKVYARYLWRQRKNIIEGMESK